MKKIVIQFVLAVLFLMPAGLTGQVTIAVTAEKDSFETGENIPVELTIRFEDQQSRIKLIRFSVLDSLGVMNYLFPEDSIFSEAEETDFDISDQGLWTSHQKTTFTEKELAWADDSPKGVFRNQLVLKIWDPGFFRIMITELQYEDGSGKIIPYFPETNEAKIVFINGASVGEPSQLAPIDPIIKRTFPLLYLRYILLIFSIIVLIITVVDWFKNRPPAEINLQFPVEQEIPPHEIALTQLEKLASSAYHLQGKTKLFYSELSRILRSYLEVRFKIPALENTSDEILKTLRSKFLNDPARNLLQEILSVADLVKFAKAEPSQEVHLYALQKAKEFVELTKFVPSKNDQDK